MEKSSNNSRAHEDVQGQPVAKKPRMVLKTIIYDETKANQWLDDPPLAVWDHMIIPFLSLRDLALSRHVCTFFEAYWQEKFNGNVLPLRVGNDVATIDDVMGVIEILSSRREYTKASPFVVLLGKGNHEVTSSWTNPYGHVRQTTLGITRSNITFIGQGIGQTTILGGIGIHHAQNITLKQLTLTNTNGSGIQIFGAIVELVDVSIARCSGNGIYVCKTVSTPPRLDATRCEISSNGGHGLTFINPVNSNINIPFNVCLKNCISHHNSRGIYVGGKGVVNIHGNATSVDSNRQQGIRADTSGKVLLHLPSQHNTIYNNGKGDRLTHGGTITNVEDSKKRRKIPLICFYILYTCILSELRRTKVHLQSLVLFYFLQKQLGLHFF